MAKRMNPTVVIINPEPRAFCRNSRPGISPKNLRKFGCHYNNKNEIILEINRETNHGIDDYNRIVSEAQPGRSLLVLINRRGTTVFVAVQVPPK
jgi:hypothetical protein